EQVVLRRAAVYAQLLQRDAGVGMHGVEHVGGLVGDAFEGGAREVRRRGATGDPDDGAACVRVPVRRAEPGKGRDEIDAARIAHLTGQGLDLWRRVDQVQFV